MALSYRQKMVSVFLQDIFRDMLNFGLHAHSQLKLAIEQNMLAALRNLKSPG